MNTVRRVLAVATSHVHRRTIHASAQQFAAIGASVNKPQQQHKKTPSDAFPILLRPRCFSCGGIGHLTYDCTKKVPWAKLTAAIDIASVQDEFGRLQAAVAPRAEIPRKA
eukprot:Opistho-2@53696